MEIKNIVFSWQRFNDAWYGRPLIFSFQNLRCVWITDTDQLFDIKALLLLALEGTYLCELSNWFIMNSNSFEHILKLCNLLVACLLLKQG